MFKTPHPFTALLVSLFITGTSSGGVWTQKANVPGLGRADGTGAATTGKGYIGTGYTTGYTVDWYEYNPGSNTWTMKSNFGGSPNVESSCFAISGYVYLLPGPNNTDFWRYDPVLNSWTQMTAFPGGGRQAAVSFVINGLGYITTGASATLGSSIDDLWEYDPVANSWLQKANLPGVARHYAAGFSIGGKGYVGTGYSAVTGTNLNDVWAWDQATNTWAQMASLPGPARNEGTAFSIGNYGFMGGGYTPNPDSSFYKYDPVSNTWSSIAAFGGGGRVECVSFSIGSSGYLGTGWDGTLFRNDFWEYAEGDPVGLNETTGLLSQNDYKLFPNPVTVNTTLQFNEEVNVAGAAYHVLDINGKELMKGALTGHRTSMSRGDLTAGLYILEVIRDGKRMLRTNFVIE